MAAIFWDYSTVSGEQDDGILLCTTFQQHDDTASVYTACASHPQGAVDEPDNQLVNRATHESTPKCPGQILGRFIVYFQLRRLDGVGHGDVVGIKRVLKSSIDPVEHPARILVGF